MEPRLSLITLGVADVAKARLFYERLGFKASSASQDGVTFMDAGGVVLALFGRLALAEDAKLASVDAGINRPAGFSGVALAHNARSEAAVDAILAEAAVCGASLLKPGQKVFWGGYSGYFADLDGHLWEVAYNPFFPFDEAGRIRLPNADEDDSA